MFTKNLMSTLAMIITIAAFLPYIVQILQGKVAPHVISWLIWGLSTLLVFLAQLSDGAGVGAWPIGLSALITLVIALLAYQKRNAIQIISKDWLLLAFALAAIPLWWFSREPLYAVILLTTIDLLGFVPTLRKTWYQPYTESIIFFALFAIRNLFVLIALEQYSATTMIFPAAIGVACLIIVVVILLRRIQIPA